MGWHDVVSQETIKKILHFVPTGSRIIYVDYPVYYNIGDQLIMLGTEAFFRENQILPLARFSAHNFPWNLSFAKDIIIVCQGGEDFGDIWDFHQNFRNRLVEKFPYNQIVILPQSIYFENQDKARKVHNILEKIYLKNILKYTFL